MTRFAQRYLDPASRLGEILFGLIMVLTVTLGAGLVVTNDRAGVRELLLAAIGCNVAWGIIDGALYIMNCITERSGKVRLLRAVRGAPNEQSALALIQGEIEPELQELLSPDEAESFNRSVLKHIAHARVATKLFTKDDLFGALACFWLVFLACLPAAIPFLIFSRPHLAMRVSNLLLIALLFLVGQKWAQFAGANRLITGSLTVAIGLALVGVAMLLGG